jgi:hypothetical protein
MFPYMVFCLFCLLLFYFLFSLSKMARPQFLYYHVRIYEKSLQPRGKVSLVLVETKLARPVGPDSPPIFAALRSSSRFIGMGEGSVLPKKCHVHVCNFACTQKYFLYLAMNQLEVLL